MIRKTILIEVDENGTVCTAHPAREWNDEDLDQNGCWSEWSEHASLDDALEEARKTLTATNQ